MADRTTPEHNQMDLPGTSSNGPDQRGSNEQSSNQVTVTTRLLSATVEADFNDQYEFLDDVNGPIHLNQMERDVVDTPEFQRLFRLSQLGFVGMVYPTANHTRATHSIGACFWAKQLVDKLNENRNKRDKTSSKTIPHISKAEKVLISLGALLHDIPHGPFSHDIEKKAHSIYPLGKKQKIQSHYGLYEKHDDFIYNPALYVFVMDTKTSVLARALRHHSSAFTQLLLKDAEKHAHLKEFAETLDRLWPRNQEELLPNLLFHLLVYEKPSEASQWQLRLKTSFDKAALSQWGLGPQAHREKLHRSWYQPFRHDIIGDTLSADLIDYLARDQARLGIGSKLDLKLLNSYTLVSETTSKAEGTFSQYRCALDLNDRKRGTFRSERLNDIFRLLDLRHQIHEKAVHHRAVQSAVAMLSRAGLILGETKPSIAELYGADNDAVAAAGDNRFLDKLVALGETHMLSKNTQVDIVAHQTLPWKLRERRIYRPLMVIPGDRIPILLENICDFQAGLEYPLRELAAIVDSPHFAPFFLLLSLLIEKLLQHAIDSEDKIDELVSELANDHKRLSRVSAEIPKRVIFWTTPYRQLYKDPAILVRVNDDLTTTIDGLRQAESISEPLRKRISAGIADAETKNEALWKFYVFISDGLFYTGILSKLLPNHPCARSADAHRKHLETAQNLTVKALRSAWQYWQVTGKKIDLTKKSSVPELSDLLKLLTRESLLFRLAGNDMPKRVSAVLVEHYLHGDASPKCRDIRYKFDTGRTFNDVLREFVTDAGQQTLIREVIRASGTDPEDLKAEETAELVTRITAAGENASTLVDKTAHGTLVDPQKLKSLWLTDLA